MPWQATTPMDQRIQFITDHQRAWLSMCELCHRYGVSRKTGYKWLAYYAAEGAAGLADHSRRPHQSPRATPESLRRALLMLRGRHPTWGAKKLRAWLTTQQPQQPWPAVSTVSKLLNRDGVVTRRRPSPAGRPASARVVPTAPNTVWATDFKGEFLTGDHRYCYPLTVMDGFSRYLLECHGMVRITVAETQQCFARLFREFGLPDVMRSDNGMPFASPALAGLSRLSAWWVQLGIRLDRITRGHPEENGSLERFHRTLKADTARPPAACCLAQQDRFDGFGWDYNYERPHEALGFAVPADRYERSPRRLPVRLPRPEYPGHWPVRRVGADGEVGWGPHHLFLTTVIRGCDVGFEEIGDGLWTIYFYRMAIGRFDERHVRVMETWERPRA